MTDEKLIDLSVLKAVTDKLKTLFRKVSDKILRYDIDESAIATSDETVAYLSVMDDPDDLGLHTEVVSDGNGHNATFCRYGRICTLNIVNFQFTAEGSFTDHNLFKIPEGFEPAGSYITTALTLYDGTCVALRMDKGYVSVNMLSRSKLTDVRLNGSVTYMR